MKSCQDVRPCRLGRAAALVISFLHSCPQYPAGCTRAMSSCGFCHGLHQCCPEVAGLGGHPSDATWASITPLQQGHATTSFPATTGCHQGEVCCREPFLVLHEDWLEGSSREPIPSSAEEAGFTLWRLVLITHGGRSTAQTYLQTVLENRPRRRSVLRQWSWGLRVLPRRDGRILRSSNTCSDALPQVKAHLGPVKYILGDIFSFFLPSLLLFIH